MARLDGPAHSCEAQSSPGDPTKITLRGENKSVTSIDHRVWSLADEIPLKSLICSILFGVLPGIFHIFFPPCISGGNESNTTFFPQVIEALSIRVKEELRFDRRAFLDSEGQTPLHVAVAAKHLDATRVLAQTWPPWNRVQEHRNQPERSFQAIPSIHL